MAPPMPKVPRDTGTPVSKKLTPAEARLANDLRERQERARKQSERQSDLREQRHKTFGSQPGDAFDTWSLEVSSAPGGKMIEQDYDEPGSPVLYDVDGSPRFKPGFLSRLDSDTYDAMRQLRQEHEQWYRAVLYADVRGIPLRDIAAHEGVRYGVMREWAVSGRAFVAGYIRAQQRRDVGAGG